jgi:hypothetical protein
MEIAMGSDIPTYSGGLGVRASYFRQAIDSQGRQIKLADMKGAISRNAAPFNSYRMTRRYATEAYLR